MRSRVHFVNRYFYPDLSATSQILSGIAFDLAAQGHDIHVVTSRQLYENAAADLPADEVVHGVTVHRLHTTRFGRQGLAGRLIDYLSFYVALACHLAWTLRKGDIVVAKTDPPMLSLVTTPIARLRGARSVNWLQDVFPEVVTAVGVAGSAGRVVANLIRPLRNWSLATADRTVAIGERMGEYLVAQGVPAARVSVIANWSDAMVVHPIPHWQNGLRQEWGLKDKLVIGYSGNLGRVHDFATIVDAIEILHGARATQASAQDMVFVFSGNGAQRAALEEEIARRGVGAMVQLHPYQPLDRLAQSLGCADIHLVTLRPDLEGLVVPSKIYGVMAAGRPAVFVGATDGEVARLLRRERCGVSVAVGDGAGLAQALRSLAADGQLRESMGARARAAFETAYTRQQAVHHWQELLQPLGLTEAGLDAAGNSDAPSASRATSDPTAEAAGFNIR